jgi:hypothetical protein
MRALTIASLEPDLPCFSFRLLDLLIFFSIFAYLSST